MTDPKSDTHYTDGRRWSYISNAWIFESDWNDKEEIARLKHQLTALQSAQGRDVGLTGVLRNGLLAVEGLISESYGVTGLHRNGDVATWDELRTGGHFEAWLIDFDRAIEALANPQPTRERDEALHSPTPEGKA